MKKNIAPLVCGIIGTFFGLIGGFFWVSCADFWGTMNEVAEVGRAETIWMVLFIVFGLGGPVIGLIGSILAFGFKRAGGVLLLFAMLFCIGHIVVTMLYTEGMFTFVGEMFTIFALILFLVAVCFGFRKAPKEAPAPQQPYYGQPPYTPPYYGQPPYGIPQQPYYGQPPYGGQPRPQQGTQPQQGMQSQQGTQPQQGAQPQQGEHNEDGRR